MASHSEWQWDKQHFVRRTSSYLQASKRRWKSKLNFLSILSADIAEFKMLLFFVMVGECKTSSDFKHELEHTFRNFVWLPFVGLTHHSTHNQNVSHKREQKKTFPFPANHRLYKHGCDILQPPFKFPPPCKSECSKQQFTVRNDSSVAKQGKQRTDCPRAKALSAAVTRFVHEVGSGNCVGLKVL